MTPNPYLTPAILDAEASVLGGLILAQHLLRDIELETDDFGDMRHRVVFSAMRNLEAAARPIDVLTLEGEIEKAGKLDAVGGVAFLGELVLRVPTVANVYDYARSVRDAHVKRRVMLAASDLVELCKAPDVTGEQTLESAAQRFGAIDGIKAETVVTIGDLAVKRFADVERFAQEQLKGGHALSGAPTGIGALDAKTGGWQFGIVNLLAARPGMGKSSLALATADACSLAGYGVHVFSLEDSAAAYTDRQLARLSGVPAIQIRRAEFGEGQVGALYRAMVDCKTRKGWLVDERGALTAAELVRALRRNQDKNGTRVGICDYLQLLKKRDGRQPDHEHLGECMQTLAESAKVDGVAWLVLSQFNRKLEERQDKRPQLSDLRGSGEIEEKCKLAIALYRGAYYGGKPKRDIDYECDCPEAVRSCAHAPNLNDWEAQAQVLILKGGNGPTGRVMASWDGPTTRIW